MPDNITAEPIACKYGVNLFSNRHAVRLRNYRKDLWLPGEIIAEIDGLSEPWIRARDARWYKYNRKNPNPFEGIIDHELDQSMVQHPDICINMDPHSLTKEHFSNGRGIDHMQILSMEYGAWGLAEYFTHVHIAVSGYE
eukprot:2419504-Karenia_brevis.AAC.1